MNFGAIIITTLLGCIGCMGCSSLPKNPEDRSKTLALAPANHSRIAKELKLRLGQPPHAGESAFSPLVTGEEALLARLTAAHLADHTLDLQYYIWANDLTGRLMMDYVLHAADRGVRVRILLDDLNCGPFEKGLAILDTHPLIEIRLSNPFAHRSARWLDVFQYSRTNRRMHNKAFIADNEIGIVGGRNIGDEYFWASEEMNFNDFDLWAAGPIVRGISQEFDAYWNSTYVYPISALIDDRPSLADLEDLKKKAHDAHLEALSTPYEAALRETLKVRLLTEKPAIFWSRAQVLYDSPEKLNPDADDLQSSLSARLQTVVDATEKEILLVSPYFIPKKNSFETLNRLGARGVGVTVLTNSLASNDVPAVFGGYKGHRDDLIRSGVQLYELKPTAIATPNKTKRRHVGSSGSQSGLHGKVFVFDRKKIFVGSMNLDPRSISLNSEMGILVESPELAHLFAERLTANLPQMAYQLDLDKYNDLVWSTIEKSEPVKYHKDPETSWWQRFKAGFMGVMIPSKEL